MSIFLNKSPQHIREYNKMQKLCSPCGKRYTTSEFYQSSLRSGESRCKRCNNAARLARRHKDPLRHLQWKVYRSEYQRGHVEYPQLELVADIVQRFQGKCALTQTNQGGLCVVRFFSHLPICRYPWNGVLVSGGVARRLPRADQAKRSAAFPAWLAKSMMAKVPPRKCK